VTAPASLAAEGADVQGMFNRVAGRYDAANRVMSAGVDVLWRRKAMSWLLGDDDGAAAAAEAPRLLDLGAGTLDGAVEIVRRRPGARVVGADFAREMLRVGRAKIPAGAAIETHAADGHHLPYRDAAFDGAFSAFCVRNLADLPAALAELRRVVRPGGRVAILEFFRPERTRFFFDKIYNSHVLPLLGWAVTGDRAAYRYLPQSIERFVTRPDFEALLRAAGFAQVDGQPLFPSGVASLVTAR
jgi:demethylmenaquinone methyltransferase/2-methoxy-6-polyprenyl-1,4-benzoquinol methylase